MPSNLYIDTVFAVDGDRTAVPDPIQGSGVVSYAQGYSIAYSTPVASGGYDFPRNQHNQILYDITAAVQNMQQNGAAYFITSAMNGGSAFSYILGAIAAYDAGSGMQVWVSTAAANTTTPGGIGAHWALLTSPSSPLFIGGASTGSANAQAVATNQGDYANTAGNIVTFKAGIANTSAATLTVDSVTNIPLKKASQSGIAALVQGDLILGCEYISISDGTNLQVLNPSSTSVGSLISSALNLKASVTSASATATWTADEVTVGTALGGAAQNLTSFSQALNLGTTGAGGMDTGAAPASGYVCLYAIAKIDGTQNILACNVTTSSGPIYSGANMPSGYTYSALIGTWPTNGSSQFVVGYQNGHTVNIGAVNVLNVTSSPSLTYTSVGLSSAIPPNAKKIGGILGGQSTPEDITIAVAADANGTGEQLVITTSISGGNIESFYNSAPFFLNLITSQTLYYKAGESSNTPRINITSYDF